MSKPEKSNQPTANHNQSQQGRARRPAKWTYLELIGLALSFLLIIGPILLVVTDALFPGSTARAANVVVTKAVDNSVPAPGTNIRYSITIQNTSGGDATFSLQDNLPTGLTYVSSSTTLGSGTTVTGNAVEAVGSLSDNGIATLTIICKVDSNVANGTVITNTVSGFYLNSSQDVATQSVPITVTGAVGPTNTPTNTPIPPTNTPVPGAPTNTPVPPVATNTPVPPAPTNTPVPAATNTPSGSGGGSGGGGAATPTNTVPGVPAGATVGNGGTVTAVAATLIAGLRSPAPGAGVANTPTAANANPTATNSPQGVPTNTPGIPPLVSGVVSGAYSSNVGGLGGTQVSLIRRGGGTDETIKTALIDGSNQYFFSSVPATAPGQVYFVRYSNTDPGSGLLRLFSSNPFSFAGGTYRVPTADVSDVRTGPPGTSNTAFQLPLSLSWFVRSSEDRYSVTVFRANSGPILDSGNLGANTSFTVQNGQLAEGNYLAQINVVNPLGTGIANRQFTFRVVPGILIQPTATGAAAVATVSAPTNTPQAAVATPTASATSGGPQVSGNNSQPTTAPSPSAVAGTSGGPNAAPNTLPSSGGELPIFGLMLAGFTLLMRRVRLVRQTR